MMTTRKTGRGVTTPLLLSFLLLSAATFGMVLNTAADNGTTHISVIPDFQAVGFNETFTVDITVELGEPLYALQCDVHFDPTLIRGISVANGDLFSQLLIKNINNATGVVQLAATLTGTGVNITESGTLATITFEAKDKVGVSTLELTNAIVVDWQLTELPYELHDGEVAVGSIPVAIDPASQTVPMETNFTVNVTIDPTQPIAGAQCAIQFNASLLEAVEVENGDMFNTFSDFQKIDNTNGTITNIVAFNNVSNNVSGATVSESGTFVTIHFTTRNVEGTSPLDLFNVDVADANGTSLPVIPLNGSVKVEVDQIPPEVNITSLTPSAEVGNITYGGIPLTINITVIEENLAEVMFIIGDSESGQFLYGKNYDYQNYSGTLPSNYSEIWAHVYNITNGTAWEEHITVWDMTTEEHGHYIVAFGLLNETGGEPEMPVVAIFDPATYEFWGIYPMEGQTPVNVTTGVSTFRPLNMVFSDQPDGPQWENTSTILVVTENFTLVPTTPPETNYSIFAVATDMFENEGFALRNVTVDTTPPAVTRTVSGTQGANDWYISEVTLTLEATDAGVGGETIYYRNGTTGDFMLYSGPLPYSQEGTTTIGYYAVDALGNAGAEETVTFAIDTTDPTIDIGLTPADPTGDNGWYTGSVTVTLAAADEEGGSGLASIEYRLGSGSWNTYDAPFPLSASAAHTLSYRATDNASNTVQESRTIKIDTVAPTTTATLSGTREGAVYITPVTVSLSPSDAASGIASTRYRVNGGTWNTGTSTTLTADGTYTVDYYSVDKAGNIESTTSITFQILQNQPPTAAFGYTPQQPTTLDTITFDASTSTDADGEIVNYTWNFGDDTAGYGKKPTHQYARTGNYTVTLTVTDDKGSSDSLSKTVTVVNDPPTAYFTYQPDTPKIDDVVTFTDASTDDDGELVNWTWDFGDGNVSYEQSPTHAYDQEGTYTVTLTVTDDDGDTDSTSLDITVEEEKPDYLLPLIAIIILIIIAIIVVIIWRQRSSKTE